MMKKVYFGLMIVALSAVLASCEPVPTVVVKPDLLVGRWEAPSQAKDALEGANLVFVFQEDSCIVDGVPYGRWGYQIDLGDEERDEVDDAGISNDSIFRRAEEYMFDESDEGTFHRNGWFGWEVVGDAEIRLINMTSVGSAKVPVTNTVTFFSASSMTMVDGFKTYHFKKVK